MLRSAATPSASAPRQRGARRLVTVFTLIGAALAVFGGWKSWEALHSGGWPRAPGVITASRVRVETPHTTSGTSRVWYPDVSYRYTVAGRAYQGHRVWLTERGGSRRSAQAVAARYRVGQAVEVAYDPRDPARAVLEPGALGGAWIPLAIGALFVGLSLWFRHLFATGLVAAGSAPDGTRTGDTAPIGRPLVLTGAASRRFLWVFAGVWVALSLPFAWEMVEPLTRGSPSRDERLMAAFALAVTLAGPLLAVLAARRITRLAGRGRTLEAALDAVHTGNEEGGAAARPADDSHATRRPAQQPRADRGRLLALFVAIAIAAFVLTGGIDRVRGLLGDRDGRDAHPPSPPPASVAPAEPGRHGAAGEPPRQRAGAATPPRAVEALPSSCPAVLRQADELAGSSDADALAQALHDLLVCKITRPDYTQWKRRGLSNDPQPFPEEAAVQALRTRLAALRQPPAGADVTTVPVLASAPRIDGVVTEAEWAGSLMLPLHDTGTRLRAASDGERLYLAADVPGERTAEGFDQMRVYLHVGLSPWLRHERAHLSPGGRIYTARISDVRFPGQPPAGGWPDAERWKRWRLDEGGVWPGTTGASTLDGHRQYELAVPLAEAGITRGVAFTVAVEIETDPTYRSDPATGKRRFQHRNDLGTLGGGGDGAGVWWVVP